MIVIFFLKISNTSEREVHQQLNIYYAHWLAAMIVDFD